MTTALQSQSSDPMPHITNRIRLLDHTVDLLLGAQVLDVQSRWHGGFLDPLRLLAEPWYAAGAVDVMCAVLPEPGSRHFDSKDVLDAAVRAMEYVNKNQYDNGTIDAYFVGDMQAAPNVAFVSRMLCRAYRKLDADLPSCDASELKALIRRFLVRGGRALIDRRAYTPNHRWVIADALLQVNALFPDPELTARAMRYLDEGIDINEDGMYSERSTSYGMLTNETLISIGELTGDPRYHDYVARNLEFALYLLQPNGEDAYQFSIRQDAVVPGTRIAGEDVFRYMAASRGDGRFASMADFLAESAGDVDAQIKAEKALWSAPIPDEKARFPSLKYSLLSHMSGRGKLLSPWAYVDISHIQREPLPRTYRRVYPTSRLVRIREDGIAASVMGMQQNLFSLHAGSVVLEGLRVRYLYHNWKSFVPQSFQIEDDTYVAKGSFLASKEGPKFPEEDEDLLLSVRFKPTNGAWRVRVEVEGQPMVPVQVELALRPTGQLIQQGTKSDLKGSTYLFATGDFQVSTEDASISFTDIPRRVHRTVDHHGGWMGNIPFTSVFITDFSPCAIEFSILGERR